MKLYSPSLSRLRCYWVYQEGGLGKVGNPVTDDQTDKYSQICLPFQPSPWTRITTDRHCQRLCRNFSHPESPPKIHCIQGLFYILPRNNRPYNLIRGNSAVPPTIHSSISTPVLAERSPELQHGVEWTTFMQALRTVTQKVPPPPPFGNESRPPSPSSSLGEEPSSSRKSHLFTRRVSQTQIGVDPRSAVPCAGCCTCKSLKEELQKISALLADIQRQLSERPESS